MNEEPLDKGLSFSPTTEIIRLQEITIRKEILDELSQRTRESAVEFWVFILGREGVGEKYLTVGISHRHGVLTSPEQVVQDLEPHLTNGYTVIADYHNHPFEDISDYTAAGFRPNMPLRHQQGICDKKFLMLYKQH